MILVDYDYIKLREYFTKNIASTYDVWNPDKDGDQVPMVKWLKDIGAMFVVKEMNEMGEVISYQLRFSDEADAVAFKLMIG